MRQYDRYRPAHTPWQDPRADRLALAVLLLLGSGLPALLAIASGSLGIPHNDDFSYARTAIGLYASGQIQSDHWSAVSLIGQTLLAQPFLWLSGGATWSLGVYGLAWSAVAVVAAYLLARRFLGVTAAFFVGLGLVFLPGYVRTASTFMTDVPCLALSLACLLLAVIAVERDFDGRYLAASLAVGLLGVTIREAALAAPLSVLIVTVLGERRWRRAVLAIAAAGITTAAIVVVTRVINGPPVVIPMRPLGLDSLSGGAVTLGALLLPVLVIPATRTRTAILIACAVALVVLVGGSTPGQMMGNLWAYDGMMGQSVLLGPRPVIFDETAWTVTRWAGTVGATAMLVVLGQTAVAHARTLELWPPRAIGQIRWSMRSPLSVLAVFAVLYTAVITVYVALVNSLDRYLWDLVPVVSILVLAGARANPAGLRRVGRLAAVVAMVAIGIVASLLALNSTAYDVARWRMGEEAVSRGYAPNLVDAGYEWFGAHATGPARWTQAGYIWYEFLWSPPIPCAIVANGPQPDPSLHLVAIETVAYRLFWLGGTEQPLYLYGTPVPGCPGVPSSP